MSSAELWVAVRDLANVWAATPEVAQVVRELPCNAKDPTQGLPGLLRQLEISAPDLARNPLRFGSTLAYLVDQVPVSGAAKLKSDHAFWLVAAEQVERAHRLTIAWLRSRLPGYPILRAPQLARGTPLTTQEFTFRLVWPPGELSMGLHLADVPPRIARTLGANKKQEAALRDLTKAASEALLRTEEWQALRIARQALDPTAVDQLGEARKAIAERLQPEQVDAHEPRLALGRNQYRTAVVDEELEKLTGTAREYAKSFAEADYVVELATSDVFGELVRNPVQRCLVSELEFFPGRPSRIHFSLEDGPDILFLDVGSVIWVSDPSITDAVRLTGLEFKREATGESSIRASAEVLDGTAGAWR